MSVAVDKYNEWLEDDLIDQVTKQELRDISAQPKEIEDRFYRDLQFGTGGLRGVLGAGTNRMNKYTVGLATQGLAQFLLQQFTGNRSIVIAYDSRNQSPEFALEAALVMAGNGIKAYVFRTLRPTPELSFAVRYLKASSGIVITASHNPPEYNGYKAYDANGCQYLTHDAELIIEQVQQLNSLGQVKRLAQGEAEAAGLLEWIDEAVDQAFIHAVTAVSQTFDKENHLTSDLKIVFTPLHGAGNLSVRRVLQENGFRHVYVVPEQEKPDALFSTVTSPNPEEKQAFVLAVKLAEQKEADLVIGTDPDCDRMGIAVRNQHNEYIILTGNQTGAILIHYLLSRMKEQGGIPTQGIVFKTIVTSEMGAKIAQSYGVKVENTLTGFKYIGEKISQIVEAGVEQFIFGYEESYGYLAGTHCRDKDGVVASLLISEAAAYYKSRGKTLYEVLQQLYKVHGFFLEKLQSITLKGKEGLEQMGAMMAGLRENPLQTVNGQKVREIQDYLLGINGLPEENVLKYFLADGSWFCIRPSGTEPKIKIYLSVCCQSEQGAASSMDSLVEGVMGLLMIQ
ncbi:MAG TPA: phospho-sugar mutase [Bacilli bacterium]